LKFTWNKSPKSQPLRGGRIGLRRAVIAHVNGLGKSAIENRPPRPAPHLRGNRRAVVSQRNELGPREQIEIASSCAIFSLICHLRLPVFILLFSVADCSAAIDYANGGGLHQRRGDW